VDKKEAVSEVARAPLLLRKREEAQASFIIITGMMET